MKIANNSKAGRAGGRMRGAPDLHLFHIGVSLKAFSDLADVAAPEDVSARLAAAHDENFFFSIVGVAADFKGSDVKVRGRRKKVKARQNCDRNQQLQQQAQL